MRIYFQLILIIVLMLQPQRARAQQSVIDKARQDTLDAISNEEQSTEAVQSVIDSGRRKTLSALSNEEIGIINRAHQETLAAISDMDSIEQNLKELDSIGIKILDIDKPVVQKRKMELLQGVKDHSRSLQSHVTNMTGGTKLAFNSHNIHIDDWQKMMSTSDRAKSVCETLYYQTIHTFSKGSDVDPLRGADPTQCKGLLRTLRPSVEKLKQQIEDSYRSDATSAPATAPSH